VERHHNYVAARLRRILHAEFTAGTSPIIEQAAQQLEQHFAGRRETFDVPLLFVGTDPQRLWSGITLCIEAEGDSTYKSAVQELNLRLSPDLLRRLGTSD
jgi:methylated-DNA-protein-cysteine methyltransferase